LIGVKKDKDLSRSKSREKERKNGKNKFGEEKKGKFMNIGLLMGEKGLLMGENRIGKSRSNMELKELK